MRHLLLLIALAACEKAGAPPPKTAMPMNEPAPSAKAAPSEKPEGAPDGVVTPKVGKLREALPGNRGTAYLWMAIYEVDAPASAAVTSYREQLLAAGIGVTEYGPMFTYPCSVGDVFVKPEDDVSFSLSVSPPGG